MNQINNDNTGKTCIASPDSEVRLAESPSPTKTGNSDSLIEDVLRPFAPKDRLVRKGCDQWLDDHRKNLATIPLGEMVHKFTSDEMRERTVRYFQADIEENIALLRAKLARQRREEAGAHLRAGLAEHDGFFLEDGDEILPHRMGVWRVTRAHQLDRMKKLVQFSQDFVDGKVGLTPEQLVNGELPEILKGHPVTEYTKDLGEYIIVNGDRAKNRIHRVCEDKQYAEEVIDDPQSPKPLRFLAEIANEVRTAVAIKSSVNQPRVGFSTT